MVKLNKETLISNYQSQYKNVSTDTAKQHLNALLTHIASSTISKPGDVQLWAKDVLDPTLPTVFVSTGLYGGLMNDNHGPEWAAILYANTDYIKSKGIVIDNFNEGGGIGGMGTRLAIQSEKITQRYNELQAFIDNQTKEALASF